MFNLNTKSFIFIPLLMMVLGGIISIAVMTAGMSLLNPTEKFSYLEPIVYEFEEPSEFSIFIEELDHQKVIVTIEQNVLTVTSDLTLSQNTTVLTLTKNTGDAIKQTDFMFDVNDLDELTGKDGHLNFVDVEIYTPGKYTLTATSDDAVPVSLVYMNMDTVDIKTPVMNGAIGLGITSVVSFASLVGLIILRKKKKSQLIENEDFNNYHSKENGKSYED